MLSHAVVAALACFASVIDAAPQRPAYGPGPGPGPGPRYSAVSTRCYTKQGTAFPRGGVRTSWSTSAVPCTSTSTVTETSTSTPPLVTSVITSTDTTTYTAPTSMLTSVTTTTSTTTIATDTTTTTVVTDTSTTYLPSTSTVPAPPQFTPIQQTLPGASYAGIGGTSPVAKRDVDKRQGFSPNQRIGLAWSKGCQAQAVTCYAYSTSSKCSTSVSTTTATVIASTSTTTSTTTMLITSTVVPSATTTLTDTAISTVTTTNTVVTTSTVSTTVSYPAATVYAACALNNFADHADGMNIPYAIIGDNSDYSYASFFGTGAYDCCVSAMTGGPGAQTWSYDPKSTSCSIVYQDVCPTPNKPWVAYKASGGDTYVYGNAACGAIISSKLK